MHQRTLRGGIFFLSLSILLLELILIRLFSVVLLSNLSYLAISVALFGVAFGGVMVYVLPRYFTEAALPQRLRLFSLLYGLSILALLGYLLALEPLRSADRNIILFVELFAAAAVPLLLANICLTLIFKFHSRQMSQLYFFDLLGAALGVVAAVLAMTWLPAASVFVLAAVVACISALLFGIHHAKHITTVSLLLLISIGLIGLNLTGDKLEFRIILNKIPAGDNLIFSKWNSFSHVSILTDDQAEAVSSLPTHIPGPEKLGIRIDGAAYTPIYKFSGDIRKVDYLRTDLSSIAFQLRPGTTSLVIGSGGGRDLLMARLFDHQVTGVDINPIITDTIMRDEFQDYSGGIYTDPNVTIHVAEGRSFVSQSQESFDVITIPLVDTWASTINGNLALVESYLYTTEAFATYLERLTPDGILSVSRWEQSGPRLLSLFLDAAEQLAITEPENKIMVIENDPRIGGQLHNVLMKRQAFTPDEITQVEAFAEENNFKILYAPDSERGTVYDDYLRAPDRDEFVRTFSKNLLASTDDQPFFFFLLNFKHFNGREIGSFDGGLLAAAIAVFAFSIFTIGFPGLTFSGYRQLRGHGKTFLRYAGYFGGLGIGFILIELALIQKFVLYLEHPIYSYSVVLAGLLLFAGFGSVISARLNPLRNKSIILVGVGITLVQLFYALGLSPLISATLGWSIASKITIAALLTIPSAILMGMLLPLGFKRLELTGHQQLIPMSWAVNGAASVMGSTLAIILAIQFGFTRVLLIAAGVYLLGILCLISDRRPTVIVDNQL